MSRIFEEKGLSGASVNRPALTRCGDTLIVWKLDRLGRSLRDLLTMLDDLRARGVKIPFTPRGNRHSDANRPRRVADDRCISRTGKEPDFRAYTRRGEGRAAPRCEVRRKVKLTPDQIDHARKLIEKGEARQYLADLLNVGRSTLYRALAV